MTAVTEAKVEERHRAIARDWQYNYCKRYGDMGYGSLQITEDIARMIAEAEARAPQAAAAARTLRAKGMPRPCTHTVAEMDAVGTCPRCMQAENERLREVLREVTSQCHNLPRSATADRIDRIASDALGTLT